MDVARLVLDTLEKLAWPIVAGAVFVTLLPHIRKILSSRDFSVKVAGMEISVQKVSEDLRRLVGDLQTRVDELQASQALLERTGTSPSASEDELPQSEEATRKADHARGIQRRHGREDVRVLWVDDQPENNAFEIAILEQDGAQVERVRSTSDALPLVRYGHHGFDAVVTDLVRVEGSRENYTAGLELVRGIREANVDLPIILYSTAGSLDRLRARGDVQRFSAATASSSELLSLLTLSRVMTIEVGEILRTEGVPFSEEAVFQDVRFDLLANLDNVALPIIVVGRKGRTVEIDRGLLDALERYLVVPSMPPVAFVTRFADQIVVAADTKEVLGDTIYRHVVSLPQFRGYVRRRLEDRRSSNAR